MKFSMDSGEEFAFANIPREEYAGLEAYCLERKIRIQDEMQDEGPTYEIESDGSGISIASDMERTKNTTVAGELSSSSGIILFSFSFI